MFCEDCGKKLIKNSLFCDNCGISQKNIFKKGKKNTEFIKKINVFSFSKLRSFSFHNLVILILIIILIGGGFGGYKLYNKIQQSLQKTQSELFSLRTSTAGVVSSQQESIKEQEKQLTEKERELKKTENSNALLQNTINNIEQKISNIEDNKEVSQPRVDTSKISLDEIAPSIVSIFCLTDSYSDDVQSGSGVLYRASSNNSDLSPYYVQTNLHVVQTRDNSVSECLIVLYPNYKNSNVYLLFESESYRFYRNDIDVAFLKPQIMENESRAGSMNDLAIFSQSESKSSRCDSVNIGDNVTVLGYPGIGGYSLTVTDGIVSGFEFYDGIRYIKTSAKIEQGNSGGIAIKDSGCVLGIPTFVQTGEIESLGRIIDFGYLFDKILK